MTSDEELIKQVQHYLKADDAYMQKIQPFIEHIIPELKKRYNEWYLGRALCNEILRQNGLEPMFPPY